MRIIGGAWRSRRLLRPETDTTRPMPDRVKQTIFDMLGSLYDRPGALSPLLVADVFAGSGSIGLEALSRGAAFCCFFDHNLNALEILRRNVESLGAARESCIVPGDAWRAVMTTPDGRPFTLIFLDPPYWDCEDTTERGAVRRFLRKLIDVPVDERLVVLHHPAGTHFELTADDPWRVVQERRIGSNAVTFFAS